LVHNGINNLGDFVDFRPANAGYTLAPPDLALLALVLQGPNAFAPDGGTEVQAATFGKAIQVTDRTEAWRELVACTNLLFNREIRMRDPMNGTARRVRWLADLSQITLRECVRVSLNPVLRTFLADLVSRPDVDMMKLSTRYSSRLAEIVREAVARKESSFEHSIAHIESALGIAFSPRFGHLRTRVLEPTAKDFNAASRAVVITEIEVVRNGRVPSRLIFRMAKKVGDDVPQFRFLDNGQGAGGDGGEAPPELHPRMGRGV